LVGLGDILVSGTSGLLAELASLRTEVLLVDVARVVFCVIRCCTRCGIVGLLWVTTTERHRLTDSGRASGEGKGGGQFPGRSPRGG